MPTSTNVSESEASSLNSIGALLRETRHTLGGDLDAIAETLRIRVGFLQAIEESRYDRLPAQVYAIGFVRAYAAHLGLDGDEAVRRFKQETADLETPRGLSFPVPLVERSIPGGRMLLAALILALCGYGLWYYVSTGERARPERVSAVPSDLAGKVETSQPVPGERPPDGAAPSGSVAGASMPVAPPPADAMPATAGSAPSAAAPQPSAPAAASPAPAASPPAGAAAPVPAVEKAASPAAPLSEPLSNQGRVYGAAGQASRIVITVKKDSWVQIHDGDRVLLDKVLHPGDSYRVGDRLGLVMRTGNAAGLDIEVDGRPAPPIKGTVRHRIALDPDRLIAGTAAAD